MWNKNTGKAFTTIEASYPLAVHIQKYSSPFARQAERDNLRSCVSPSICDLLALSEVALGSWVANRRVGEFDILDASGGVWKERYNEEGAPGHE